MADSTAVDRAMADLFPPDVLRALEVRRHERAMAALRDSRPLATKSATPSDGDQSGRSGDVR